MAIQLRRGSYADFDPNKMLAGELAVVTSGDPASNTGRTLYVCFAPGIVKRIVSYEDFENELSAATEEIQEAFTGDIQAKIAACTAAITAANNAQASANEAAEAANAAAEAASAYILGDISNKTVTFSEADARENLSTGESTATLFGKIKKFFSDLKTVAFTGSYADLSGKPALGEAAGLNTANNLTTNVEGYLLDARQGKALNDKYDELNTKMTVTDITSAFTSGNNVVVDKAFKFGNVIFVNGQIKSGQAAGWITATTITSIYKPIATINCSLGVSGFNEGSTSAYLRIGNNGVLNGYVAIGLNNPLSWSAVYLCNV